MSTVLKRILYLEDDPLIAELAMMGLEDVGEFEVRHCASGAEALKAITEFTPQLCLFDVMLPDMDGLQTLEAVRASPNGSGVVAIFMTAKAQIHQQKAYLAAGVLGVIVKPFDPITLADKIRTFWDERPAVTATSNVA